MTITNPLKQVGTLLAQFTTLQAKLSAAVDAIKARRQARLENIAALEAEVAECDAVAKQAQNAITGINKLLAGE